MKDDWTLEKQEAMMRAAIEKLGTLTNTEVIEHKIKGMVIFDETQHNPFAMKFENIRLKHNMDYETVRGIELAAYSLFAEMLADE